MTTESETEVASSQISQVKYTNGPTSEDWERVKPILKELYVDQNMKLKQVRKTMIEQHGYFASEKMYKSRFSMWHMEKNVRSGMALYSFVSMFDSILSAVSCSNMF